MSIQFVHKTGCDIERTCERNLAMSCWQQKKSSSILTSGWKHWKLTRNFSLSCTHDVIDLNGSLAYQLAAVFSCDMMNNLARVVSSSPNEAIAAS
jgi:hypothetical protein